ncbi:MAG: hypothetical protein P8I13_06370 [Porticoccaceae bacterium]|nr:hypothetical protein [Porticoccaceae bacterium]
MKNILLIVLFFVGFSGSIQAATDFEKDEQYFYVEDPLNDSLKFANFIVCMLSSMRPDAYVNDGYYLAAFYLDDCFEDSEDISEEQYSAKAQKVDEKETQAATGSSSEEKKNDQKPTLESLLNVTRNSTADPVITHAWIGHDDPEMEAKVFARIQQTAEVSDSAPNGEFEMHFTVLADEQHPNTPTDEFQAWGILKAEGSTIAFIEEALEYTDRMTATYLENGDITGGFEADLDIHEYDEEKDELSSFYQGFYQFYINNNNKFYCKKLAEVQKISVKPKADKKDLYTKEQVSAAEYNELGISADEVCYSTDRKNARRHVFNYGVYNQDGSRLDTGLTQLSLQAEATDNDGDKVTVYAYAGSRYVWVDDPHLVNENMLFKQQVYDDEDSSDTTYRLKPTQFSVQKYEDRKLSLNSLDAIPFEISKHYLNLSLIKETNIMSGSYVGVYDAKTGTIALTHRDIFNEDEDGQSVHRREAIEDEDREKYTFDIANLVNIFSDDDYFYIYSPQLGHSYKITGNALRDPTDNTAVTTGIISTVNLSELEDLDLFCVDKCLTVNSVKQTFDQVKQKLAENDKKESSLVMVASPHITLNESLALANLPKYKISGNKIYQDTIASSNQIFKENALSEFLNPNEDYYDQLENIRFEGSWSAMAYGVKVGVLIKESDIDKLKCENENLYCLERYYERLDTYYVLRFEVEPSFEVLTERGKPLIFDLPKTLYYRAPMDSDPAVAGKRFALEYFDDRLRGIPGYIYDSLNDKDMGEYTNEWKDSYRFLHRFVIPDGVELVDADGNKFKVKALDGDEWLAKAPDMKGKQNYSFSKDKLLSSNSLYIKDDKDAFDIIGTKPKVNIINDGKPSVLHGKILYDPTPDANTQ